MNAPTLNTLAVDPAFAALAPEMAAWRRDIHAHPELSGEETRTAGLVAEALRAMGLQPHTGVGGTGVVAVVEGREPGPTIGLRADMDALPMPDHSGADHVSRTAGVSHACGHDGHTATLLGVARRLAAQPPARGRVVLIFQPAEENGLGARAMIEDGLLDRFPLDEVYAYHNMPLLPFGQAAVRAGPTLTGYRIWEIEVSGVGGHGAAPHKTTDPLQAAARIATDISAIVGRHIDPMEPALITVTKLQAGASHNVVPHEASLAGTLRATSPEVIAELWSRLEAICDGVARTTGCTVTPKVTAEVPPCVNAPEQAALAAQAASEVLGAGAVARDLRPYPFTDDFAYLLQRTPGAYLFLGQGGPMVHQSVYDFDDALAPVAASVLTRIVEQRLD
jgi:amidohydrolase